MKAYSFPPPVGRENGFLKPATLGYSPITICLVPAGCSDYPLQPAAIYLVFIYV